MLFVSGQIPVNPSTGKVVEGGITEQTHQVLKNMEAILSEAGFTFDHVVKCTCLLADMSYFAEMNAVYSEYFSDNPPARAAFAVRGLPLAVLVEIECIAVK
jgi:2-iminobutanoate/2-iminopropanoate deaminase